MDKCSIVDVALYHHFTPRDASYVIRKFDIKTTRGFVSEDELPRLHKALSIQREINQLTTQNKSLRIDLANNRRKKRESTLGKQINGLLAEQRKIKLEIRSLRKKRSQFLLKVDRKTIAITEQMDQIREKIRVLSCEQF